MCDEILREIRNELRLKKYAVPQYCHQDDKWMHSYNDGIDAAIDLIDEAFAQDTSDPALKE